jgi:hypothetical protein
MIMQRIEVMDSAPEVTPECRLGWLWFDLDLKLARYPQRLPRTVDYTFLGAIQEVAKAGLVRRFLGKKGTW